MKVNCDEFINSRPRRKLRLITTNEDIRKHPLPSRASCRKNARRSINGESDVCSAQIINCRINTFSQYLRDVLGEQTDFFFSKFILRDIISYFSTMMSSVGGGGGSGKCLNFSECSLYESTFQYFITSRCALFPKTFFQRFV